MLKLTTLLFATAALTACQNDAPATNAGIDNVTASSSASDAVKPASLSLTRLECGTITIKNFDEMFSDRPGVYDKGTRDLTDSCYLIRHGADLMLWDTGLPSSAKGKEVETDGMIFRVKNTLVEQLAALGIKPDDINIVGISHHHSDHVGQATDFPNAKLIIGAEDFVRAQEPAFPGGPNPIGPWTKTGANVEKTSSDVDVFGDGSVTMLELPGHTPDHHALLVKLASGPVLLTGDLYHTDEARAKRAVPSFNKSRPQTLASMDKFEKLAKDLGAKVIIQHEPNDIAKLPPFPKAAE